MYKWVFITTWWRVKNPEWGANGAQQSKATKTTDVF